MLHVCESAQRVTTYPWAAEGAGGEARGGSANRPRPVARTHTHTGAEVVEGSACGPVTCFSKHRWR